MNKQTNKKKGERGKRKRERETERQKGGKGENIAYRYFCRNLGYLMIREVVKIKLGNFAQQGGMSHFPFCGWKKCVFGWVLFFLLVYLSIEKNVKHYCSY